MNILCFSCEYDMGIIKQVKRLQVFGTGFQQRNKSMRDYFIYYSESNLVCLIIFGIMLAHDLADVDRQEKQIKYDNALVAFMLYFVSDVFWAWIIAGVVPRNLFTVVTANFLNYIFMAGITYTWLEYVLALNPSSKRRPLQRTRVLLPFVLATVLLVIVFLFARPLLISEQLEVQPLYYVFLVTVPIIYIVTIVFFSLRRARSEENPVEKRKYLYIGIFPLLVIFGGLLQVAVLPNTPIFCFASTILMLIFYIQSMQTQISMDPLTRLNNRGQLYRYVSQKSSLFIEGRKVCVVMIDVNDFKSVNDTWGHSEGDRALILIAEALRKVAGSCSMPVFLSRFGGDEFLLIAHPLREEELKELVDDIRREIDRKCKEENTPYQLSVSVGYDELKPEHDSFQLCQQRADVKMYQNKEAMKRER